MRWKGLLVLALGVVGIVALANAARVALLRQPLLQSAQVKVEDTFTLNQFIYEDLVVLSDSITLPADWHIEGDVALIGGRVDVDTTISGDLTVLAEQVIIGPDAQIAGNATLLSDNVQIGGQIDGALHVRGDSLTLQPQAAIAGSVFACADALTDARAADNAARVRPCDQSDLWSSTATLEALQDPNFVLPLLNITISGAAVMLLSSLLGSVALSGVAILGVVVFPRQISHIEEAIRTNPRSLGGTGLMVIALAGGITFALALAVVTVPPLGLVLVPVYFVAGLLFVGVALAGWVTMTLIVGDMILRRLTRATLPPLVIAAVGNIALLLAWNVLVLTPYSRIIGLFALLALGSVGLGAAIITRAGTKPVHRSYLVQG